VRLRLGPVAERVLLPVQEGKFDPQVSSQPAGGSLICARQLGLRAVVDGRSRTLTTIALTASCLLAGCSAAPAAGEPFPTASASTTSVMASVVAPVPAKTAVESSPPSTATPVTPDALEQRVTAAVNASTAGRDGRINLVLHSPADHVYVDVGPSQPVRGASIIKLLILQARLAKGPLTGPDLDTAQAMITRSDNDAATRLWRQAGKTPALAAVAKQHGMTRTTTMATMFEPWDGWQTTAADQVRLLDALVKAKQGRSNTTLELMMRVEPDQAWGVGQAAEPGQPVAVKNGWLPLSSGNWILNSDGCIAPASASPVCVAITSSGSPSMAYGIQTVTAAARAAVTALHSKD
jgi:beta-lactamase class A